MRHLFPYLDLPDLPFEIDYEHLQFEGLKVSVSATLSTDHFQNFTGFFLELHEILNSDDGKKQKEPTELHLKIDYNDRVIELKNGESS